MVDHVIVGLEKLIDTPELSRNWGACGLLCNQASLTLDWQHASVVLRKVLQNRFKVIFGPQHGYMGTAQDNMIETPHGRYEDSEIKIYSLYSETREPTEEMLAEIDTLIIDLQIVGCRIYTFKATIAACLKSAKKYGKRVVVLDRPNPLGGQHVEGRCLDRDLKSFVGPSEIPMRHGLSAGEAALLFNQEYGAELEIVPLQNWSWEKAWYGGNRPWILTSPNLPTIDPVYVYPGMVIFEACNVSEGRGTGLPFQFFGSPFCSDPAAIKSRIYSYLGRIPGVFVREAAFEPTSGKWMGRLCKGLQVHILDPDSIFSYHFALAMMKSFWDDLGEHFSFKNPPYEYNYDILPLKLILGSEKVVEHIENYSVDDVFWHEGISAYCEKAQNLLLYPRELQSGNFYSC